MQMKKKQKVLLLMYPFYSLHKLITAELERMGYETISINTQYYDLGLLDRLKISAKKLIYRISRKKNIEELIYQDITEIWKNKIIKYGEYDICLNTHSDYFHDDLLKEARKHTKQMISYFYDGLSRADQNIFETIKYFDDFYVFDESDIKKYPNYPLKLTTNFIFPQKKIKVPEIFDYDFYYLAFYDKSRVEILNKISDFFIANDINFKFEIHCIPPSEGKYGGHRNVGLIDGEVSYEEYLKRMEKSKFTLDILVNFHKGLSFRIFESLLYKRKVVTNNPTVKNYDFYSPQNFFIIGERPMEELLEFMKTPFQPVDFDIINKYSFENWFNSKVTKIQ